MAEDVLHLLEEYAARFARGERPDARDYLARAGSDAPKLAALLERFAAASTPPEPDEDVVAMLRAWLGGEPPLLELRRRRGVRREALVDALIRLLSLDPAKREEVAGYYHQLETGQLAVERVDRRVLAALAETLKVRVEDVLAWPAPAPRAQAAYYRASDLSAAPAGAAVPPSPAKQVEEERDEIDRIFRGDP